jgi:hypothetical protein
MPRALRSVPSRHAQHRMRTIEGTVPSAYAMPQAALPSTLRHRT